MKKLAKIFLGVSTVSVVGGAMIRKRIKDKKAAETDTVNQLGLVNVNGSFYSIQEINAQSGDLQLTAIEAQTAVQEDDTVGQIIKLSVTQINQTVPKGIYK